MDYGTIRSSAKEMLSDFYDLSQEMFLTQAKQREILSSFLKCHTSPVEHFLWTLKRVLRAVHKLTAYC